MWNKNDMRNVTAHPFSNKTEKTIVVRMTQRMSQNETINLS